MRRKFRWIEKKKCFSFEKPCQAHSKIRLRLLLWPPCAIWNFFASLPLAQPVFSFRLNKNRVYWLIGMMLEHEINPIKYKTNNFRNHFLSLSPNWNLSNLFHWNLLRSKLSILSCALVRFSSGSQVAVSASCPVQMTLYS